MTLRIGIIGMGGMGNFHFRAYQGIPGVKVTAICDVEPDKLRGDKGAQINVGGSGAKKNLAGVKTTTRAAAVFADPKIDVVDLCLPTYLHAKYAVQALRAGKHVICEKPMARNSAQAAQMVAAAKKARRMLFVAHCIRFWPAYEMAREMLRSGKYGRLLSANFVRVGGRPLWGWKNWFMDPARSGAAALDLHIHDADYILFALGKPKAVRSVGSGFARGRFDHIVTAYDYGDGSLVVAEGAWDYAGKFPFSMTFRLSMEKAALELQPDGVLKLHPQGKESRVLKVPAGDGYHRELKHFIDCIAKRRKSPVVAPESAMMSVRLVEAEIESAKKGKAVRVR
jgi:predicted dehydrogenase